MKKSILLILSEDFADLTNTSAWVHCQLNFGCRLQLRPNNLCKSSN